MSYTVHYMLSSFASEVPWSKCDPSWADMSTCYVRGKGASSIGNYSLNQSFPMDNPNKETASLQYWERYVLHLSKGIEDIGPVKWDLALCLLFSWAVVVLCLVRGIKTSGKVSSKENEQDDQNVPSDDTDSNTILCKKSVSTIGKKRKKLNK